MVTALPARMPLSTASGASFWFVTAPAASSAVCTAPETMCWKSTESLAILA